jgi:hypothetical protein
MRSSRGLAYLAVVGVVASCTKFKTPVTNDGGDAGEGDALADLESADAGSEVAPVDGPRIDGANADADAVDTRGDGAEDAAGPSAPGTILWARSASSVFLTGVAVGPAGVVVSGNLDAPANLGGQTFAPRGAEDTLIAEFATADGAHLFSSQFGTSSPLGTGVVSGAVSVLDGSGAPLVRGTSDCDPAGTPVCNRIDVGTGLLSPGGGAGTDGFVGRFSVSTGVPSWLARLVGPGSDVLTAATNGPGGSILVAGWFDQDTTLAWSGGSRMFTGAGDRDALVAQFDSVTGAVTMSATFADPTFEQAEG